MKWFGRPPNAAAAADGALLLELRNYLEQGKERVSPDTPLRELRCVVLDTETTGFHPRRGDEVIAVGAVVVEGGGIRGDKVFHRLVNPRRPIPPIVTELTGITQEMVAGAEDAPPVLRDFFRFAAGSVIVGHSVGFDLAFLNKKLGELCSLKVPHPLLDTRVMARLLHPELPSRSLDVLLAVHGIEPHGRHSALGDALLTARLFLRFLDLLAREQVLTLGDLQRRLNRRLRATGHGAVLF
ncbi:MAG: exonuclease domain-containing protein [Bacillota bacterium]